MFNVDTVMSILKISLNRESFIILDNPKIQMTELAIAYSCAVPLFARTLVIAEQLDSC